MPVAKTHPSKKLFWLFTTLLAIALFQSSLSAVRAEDSTSSKNDSATTTESSSNKKSHLDHDALFSGVHFVKGMNKIKTALTIKSEPLDEIEGEVVVTANPYTYIPDPTGLVFGFVFDPKNEDKQASRSSSRNAVSGLTLLMNALQAGSNNK